jgi:hypothetical protein
MAFRVMDGVRSHRMTGARTLNTAIITTAILMIVGYAIITRIIGLAFRLVVPVVLILILAGAGVFSGLAPGRAHHDPADQSSPYGQDWRFPGDGSRLGDMRLGDIPGLVVDAVRSALRQTLALLDRAADPERTEPRPQDPEWRRPPRDRLVEDPFVSDDEPRWHPSPRPGRP